MAIKFTLDTSTWKFHSKGYESNLYEYDSGKRSRYYLLSSFTTHKRNHFLFQKFHEIQQLDKGTRKFINTHALIQLIRMGWNEGILVRHRCKNFLMTLTQFELQNDCLLPYRSYGICRTTIFNNAIIIKLILELTKC